MYFPPSFPFLSFLSPLYQKDALNSFKNPPCIDEERQEDPAAGPFTPEGVREMPLWCADDLQLKALENQGLSLNSPHLPDATAREGTQLSHIPSPRMTDL